MKLFKRKHSWGKMNKTRAVMIHLQEKGSITSWEAIKEYGATRLSAIIYNLRHTYNMQIINEEVYFKDKYGTNSSYAKYVLVKKDRKNSKR